MMEKLPPVQWSEAWLMYYKNKMQRLEEQLPKGSCSSQFSEDHYEIYGSKRDKNSQIIHKYVLKCHQKGKEFICDGETENPCSR